jgi:mRNA interferase MazF
MGAPRRGEIWSINLNPTLGHEQAGIRPGLVVSVDFLNQGPAELAVVIPITSKDRHQPLHVKISPPEGGLTQHSWALIEAIRSVSTVRLMKRRGVISPATMAEVEDRLRRLLGI